MVESSISRSASLASSMLAAMARTMSLTMRVAPTAAPDAMVDAREPPVDIVFHGVVAESPATIRTISMGTPISSATTWAIVVSWLWPCDTCHVDTVTWPVGSMRAHAVSPGRSNPTSLAKSGGPGAISMNVANPSPTHLPSARRGRLRGAEAVEVHEVDARARGSPVR